MSAVIDRKEARSSMMMHANADPQIISGKLESFLKLEMLRTPALV